MNETTPDNLPGSAEGAEQRGYDDATSGISEFDNPYDFDTQDALHCSWNDGYNRYLEENE